MVLYAHDREPSHIMVQSKLPVGHIMVEYSQLLAVLQVMVQSEPSLQIKS